MQQKINLIDKLLILLSSGMTGVQKALIIFIIITSLTNTEYLERPIQYLYLCIIYIIANNLKEKELIYD